ncbi:MAG: WhiB family transcriptional regulator [Actinomycetota bacterium]|nr:WhiB family transcriptional regulator [Actinomycetota bacterium]
MFDRRRQEEAKRVCRHCAVRDVCFWWTIGAEDPGERHGVSGGATATEREAVGAHLEPDLMTMAYSSALLAWAVRAEGASVLPRLRSTVGPGGCAAPIASMPASGVGLRAMDDGARDSMAGEEAAHEAEAGSVPEAPEEGAAALVDRSAAAFGLRGDELRATSRARHVVEARQVAMYVLRQATSLSYPAIGRHFGGRDHTTVMHGVRRVQDHLEHSPTLRVQVERLLGAAPMDAATETP